MNASGCAGDGIRFGREGWTGGSGALVTATITLRPRRGYPPPRFAEATAGIVYDIGCPNRGLDATLRDCAGGWQGLRLPVIVSIAGDSLQELTTLAAELSTISAVAALEVNLELLQDLTSGEPGSRASTVRRLAAAITSLATVPVLLKLAPEVDVVSEARAAAEGDADAVTIGHGWPAIYPGGRGARATVARRTPRLAGPAVLALSLRQVTAVADAVPIPIIACGGVQTSEDIRSYLAAGATAVQVGSALLRDPTLLSKLQG